jgi:hypothetical protein
MNRIAQGSLTRGQQPLTGSKRPAQKNSDTPFLSFLNGKSSKVMYFSDCDFKYNSLC